MEEEKPKSLEDLVREQIPQDLVVDRIKDLILQDKDNKVALYAIKHYQSILGDSVDDVIDEIKRNDNKECYVGGCHWKHGLDEHHIDHDHDNNTPENKIYLCPNHHYLHHRRGVLLKDLHQFL